MRVFTEEEIDERRNVKIIKTFIERICFATPRFTSKPWIEGEESEVVVQKLWNNRYCIYMQWGQDTGYLTFESLEELKDRFDCKADVRPFKEDQEVKLPKKEFRI